jgi:hypothetical protein
MRQRARTDLCGGRSVMVVPTATMTADRLVSKLALGRGGEAPVKVNVFPDKEPVDQKESFADDQSSKHIQPDSTVVPPQ